MIDFCPAPTDEAEDDWGYCPDCGCQNTGTVMPPLDGCEDVLCIPCGHYAWMRRAS